MVPGRHEAWGIAMRVLLIEDDAFKAKKIVSFLNQRFPDDVVAIERSVSSGLVHLVNDTPTVLLLDMSLSTYDVGPTDAGGRPQNFGGITVFEHMARRKIEIPVIVITQFPGFRREDGVTVSLDTLRQELYDRFPKSFKALLSYNPGDRQWEQELARWVEQAVQAGGAS